MTPFQIFTAAKDAANAAAVAQNNTLGDERSRGFDCGFAWVTIHPARGPFVSWLKQCGIGSKGHAGGWQIWYSKLHDVNTQSVSVHEAAATEFHRVLSDNGIRSEVGSRLD